MRFHCLGAGSIGSLIASNLARLPLTKVRLVLRKKDLAGALLTSPTTFAATPPRAGFPAALLSLKIESSGLARRIDGLELEITPSPEDKLDSTRRVVIGAGKGIGAQSSRIPNLVKYDPIESLFITTKAPSVIAGIQPLLSRLSSQSTVVLCHNGMGVLERLLDSYWPDDYSAQEDQLSISQYRGGGRPSFVCAITTHGVWRKGDGHYVHAGVGDIKFAVVPNRAALASIASTPSPSWGDHYNNPLLNSRSLVTPTLEHIPLTPATASLHSTISALLKTQLNSAWLPLPTFQIAQLQKLAVNSSVNSITAVIGVNNGTLMGSTLARSIISSISAECSNVFAAHLARESGQWDPPPIQDLTPTSWSSSLRIKSSPASSSIDSSSPILHPSPPPLPTSHPLSPSSLIDYTLRIIFSTSLNISSTLADILKTSSTEDSASSPSRTEIDYINGYVVALGRRYGIVTNTVETLGDLVKLKEEVMRSGAVDRVAQNRLEMLAAEKALENERIFATRKDGAPTTKSKQNEPRHSGEGVKRFERAVKVVKLKKLRNEAINTQEKDRRTLSS